MKFRSVSKKDTRYAIGISAGSAAHGLQVALVRLKGTGERLHMKLIRCENFPYRPGFRMRLLLPKPEAREIALLNFELGDLMAHAAHEMIRVARDESLEVDFIGIQGFTLCHLPPRGSDAHGMLRIGEPSVVAEHTGLPVVSDFAQRDMAAGGQGAPIGAYADWILFNRPDRTVACIHLGGISSITIVTPKMENVLAFDLGPGTLALDGAVHTSTSGGHDMDLNGDMGARGLVIEDFRDRLLEHRYFDRVPPKSTGRHEFGLDAYLRELLEEYRLRSSDDIVATVTDAIAENIGRAYMRFIRPQYLVQRVILSGGGAANRTLVRRIQDVLPDVTFRTAEQYGLPLMGCDGIASAILANETLCGTPATTPKATGVRSPVVLGKITPN